MPAVLKTVTITDASKIETAAFNNCKNITKIVLNDGITSIGDYVFFNCYYLTSITIPSSVNSISTNAFSGSSLETINIKKEKVNDNDPISGSPWGAKNATVNWIDSK